MEEPLPGGNMTQVVRVGNTVRRTAGPWTPTIHALLRHIRQHGFTAAPAPLGYDDVGRESITMLPGKIATYPLPDHALSDATLSTAGTMLRDLHDASATFNPPDDACWQLPAHQPHEVICHNDFAPYNILFLDGQPTGVIDFDTASPGPRIWDLAYMAYRFIPLTGPDNPDVPFPGTAEQYRRLHLLLEAYNDQSIAPSDVVAMAVSRLVELIAFIHDSADAGEPAPTAVLERGDTAIYHHDIEHLTRLSGHIR